MPKTKQRQSVNDQIDALNAQVEALIKLVTAQTVETATSVEPHIVVGVMADAPSVTADDNGEGTWGIKAVEGQPPTQAPPKPRPPTAPAVEATAKTVDLRGPVTYKQLRALAGLSAPASNGNRIAWMGKEGTPQRKYWSFLQKQEASDAITALKEGTPYKFSNDFTVRPRTTA